MFGSYRKLGQIENVFCVYCKIRAHGRKIIYGLILPSNNFRKSHLKRESSSTLLTRSKTHIQAHLNQASTSLAKLRPAQIIPPPWSKTHFQAYLQTIFKKKKGNRTKSKNRTPDRITASNPKITPQPQIAPTHPTLNRTNLVASQHRRDRNHDPLMPNLSLSRSTSNPNLLSHFSCSTLYSNNKSLPDINIIN